MKHISILALKHATLTSLDGSLQMFSRINDFLKYQGKEPIYKIELVGLTENTSLNDGTYTIKSDKLLNEINKTDLVIIPMICGDFKTVLQENEGFNEWIIDQYIKGAEIASLCVGSLVLASTGLLKGKKCAAHWATEHDFSRMFPDVQVISNNIITDENGIYTSGGNYSFLNLLLYLIEKHLGREMSVLASKMFEIDIERKNQSQFSIFVGQKQHDDDVVKAVQEFIENNYQEKFSIDELSTKYGIGRRTFERRFKKSTGNSFIEYIQRVRVEAAKKQLESETKTVNEIIYGIGYSDINAFRNVFRKYTGTSLTDYRNKYKIQPIS
jgi:transcriptional regulator GlxA family with amidase domain